MSRRPVTGMPYAGELISEQATMEFLFGSWWRILIYVVLGTVTAAVTGAAMWSMTEPGDSGREVMLGASVITGVLMGVVWPAIWAIILGVALMAAMSWLVGKMLLR